MARRGAKKTTRCPLCGAAAHPWVGLPLKATDASVGMLSPVDPDDPNAAETARLIDRCESCGAGIEKRPGPVDLAGELGRLELARDGEDTVFAAPNRASWQGGLGGDGWAALGEWPGRLLLTPRAFALLIEKNGLVADDPAFPPWGSNQRWMWQSILNGITLHPNFATEARAGRLRRANSRGAVAFAADTIASILATPFVLLVSVPLEALASLFGRGGRMIVRARPAPEERSPSG